MSNTMQNVPLLATAAATGTTFSGLAVGSTPELYIALAIQIIGLVTALIHGRNKGRREGPATGRNRPPERGQHDTALPPADDLR